jgi:hypothetical protein
MGDGDENGLKRQWESLLLEIMPPRPNDVRGSGIFYYFYSLRCTLAVRPLHPQLFLFFLHRLECLLQRRHLAFCLVLANENILWRRLGKKIL